MGDEAGLNDDEVYKMIKLFLEACPQLGVTGYRTIRVVDQDSFLDMVKKVLAERKP